MSALDYAMQAGAPLQAARVAAVLIHGRGGAAQDILRLADLMRLDDVSYMAPEAAGHSWWPESFLAPLAANQPHLDAALGTLADIEAALTARGFPPGRTVLAGFSQGACLALEHAARTGGRRRGVVALSGGLVGVAEAGGGPDPALHGHAPKRFAMGADHAGTPVALVCHERDPHIPLARLHESAAAFERDGAAVSLTTEPGAGHAVTPAGVEALRAALVRPDTT